MSFGTKNLTVAHLPLAHRIPNFEFIFLRTTDFFNPCPLIQEGGINIGFSKDLRVKTAFEHLAVVV